MRFADPTFESVLWLEQKQIRNTEGCGNCQHKGDKAWGKWTCKLGCMTNSHGFCRKWRYNDGEK